MQLHISYIIWSYFEKTLVEIPLCAHHWKKPFECTFLAISYNMQATLKLNMPSLLFLDLFYFVWKILNLFPSKSVWEWVVFFKGTPFWGPVRSEHQAAQLSGFVQKGRARRASFWWTGNLAWESLKKLLPAHNIFFARGKDSLINHILKTGTTGRIGIHIFSRGVLGCAISSPVIMPD